MKRHFTRLLSLALILVMLSGLAPLGVRAAAPAWNLETFSLTSSFTDPFAGEWTMPTNFTAAPSVDAVWTTAGLEPVSSPYRYEAEVLVYPGTDAAEKLSALGADRISALNGYWFRTSNPGDVSPEGGAIMGPLGWDGWENAPFQNAGEVCSAQVIVSKVDNDCSKTDAFVSPVFPVTVNWGVTDPYMCLNTYTEVGINFDESSCLEPVPGVSYRGEYYVWPGWSLKDPYSFDYGWTRSLPWSEEPDLSVLTQNGAWVDSKLTWNGGEWEDPEPPLRAGFECTLGFRVFKNDGAGETELRRCPVVQFKVWDDPGPGDEPVAVQPSVSPSNVKYDLSGGTDLTISKSDGDFTFDCLKKGGAALTAGTDYTANGGTVTIYASYLASLGAGTHEITFCYTGVFTDGTTPVNPVLTVVISEMCSPALTVRGFENADITASCEVRWTTMNGTTVEPPVSVKTGTKLKLYVTPGGALKLDGVQYYKPAEETITFTKAVQDVEITLPMQGTVTLVPEAEGEPLPAGYTVTWYNAGGFAVGTGVTSPMTDAGEILRYEIKMTGENAKDFNDVSGTAQVTFGSTALDVNIGQKTSVKLTVTGVDGLTQKDYIVLWYTRDEASGSFAEYGAGAELKNLNGIPWS